MKIENSAVSFTGSAESITFFTGSDPLALTYENSALSYSIDIPNDAEPITFVLKVELLQDSMAAMTFDMGYGATILYFNRAAE